MARACVLIFQAFQLFSSSVQFCGLSRLPCPCRPESRKRNTCESASVFCNLCRSILPCRQVRRVHTVWIITVTAANRVTAISVWVTMVRTGRIKHPALFAALCTARYQHRRPRPADHRVGQRYVHGTAEWRLFVQRAGKSVGLRSILKVRLILLDFADYLIHYTRKEVTYELLTYEYNYWRWADESILLPWGWAAETE